MTNDEIERPCAECGMPCKPKEYHPYAACLMFKACRSSSAVRANLESVQSAAVEADRKRAQAAEPVAWISDESLGRLRDGGNDSKGTVPVHAKPSKTSKHPLYPAPALPAVTDLLSADDMRWLRRFQDICEDSGADGHDVPKAAMRQLEKIGVVRSCGFGRHETTAFGDYILEAALGGGE